MKLQNKFFSILFLIIIIFSACSSSKEQTNKNSGVDIKELYFEDHISKKDHATDFVAIADATIENDVLTLEIKYTGGCKKHFFDLIVESSFNDANPKETMALLSHYANGDECKMMIDEELRFDLSALKKIYQDKYKSESGELLIRFMDNSQSVDYKF